MTSPSEPRTPSVSALVRALKQLDVPHQLDEAVLQELPPARRQTVLLATIAAAATYLLRRHYFLNDRSMTTQTYREITRGAVDQVTSGNPIRKVMVAGDLLTLSGDVAALSAADMLRAEIERDRTTITRTRSRC